MAEPLRHVRHLIIGGGIAGGAALAVLGSRVPEGEVLLVGAEGDRPYERPLLSKEYLRDGSAEIGLRELSGRQVAAAQLLGCAAVELDAASRTVTLDDGSRISCDNLLIATGVDSRALDFPGVDSPFVHTLRSLDDARRLRKQLSENPDVVIIGAGLIGTEFAGECARRGLTVTMIEQQPGPLPAMAGSEAAGDLARIYAESGVELRTGVGVARLEHDGALGAVVLSDGTRLPTTLVLVAAGARPAVDWLSSSSIALDNGVLVDEFCRTDVPGVFAAGDVAHAWHPRLGRRVRVEHESNAHIHGAVAARNMLGRRTAHTATPYAWSDQFGRHLWSFGIADPADRQVTTRSGSRLLTVRVNEQGEIRSVFGICRDDDTGRDVLVAATRELVSPPEWTQLDPMADTVDRLLSSAEESR